MNEYDPNNKGDLDDDNDGYKPPSKDFLRASASSWGEWLLGAIRVAIDESVSSLKCLL